MKKEFLSRDSMYSASRALFFLTACAIFSGLPLPRAHATAELDRKYALETVGFLRALDNVDGLFTDYVSAAYRDYFSRQSRFVLQDLSKTDAVLSQSKIPYHKLVEDREILGQISRSTKSQSIIRTRIRKEGPQYRFSFEWLHSPQMDLLANEEFILRDRDDGKGFGLDEIKGRIQETLDRMIRKVPYWGTVTGRDNNAITVNIGATANVKAGDLLVIGTLDEVKKHPLLREIVDWRLTKTGQVQIEQVEESLAFGKVTEEEAGYQVARYQKVLQIIPKPGRAISDDIPVVGDKNEIRIDLDSPPTLGWLRGSPLAGGFNRQYSNLASVAKNGGGLVLGAAAEGQLWLTRDWFTEISFAYGFWKYAQTDIATGNETTGNISGSLTDFKIAGGYTYLVTGDIFGPKAFVKFGIHSISYSLPLVTDESLAPISFKGPFMGIGGELPLRGNWGALMNLDFGLFSGATETGDINGSVTSASDVKFFIGAYYRWAPRLTLRGGFEITGNSAEYTGGSSLSQKVVTFSPTLLYYF